MSCSSEVKGLPVPQSQVEDEPDRVAHTALIERVLEVREVLEVVYSVTRGLLPSGLTSEHQVGVIEEEETSDDGGDEGDC